MKYIVEEKERWKSNGLYKKNNMITYSVRTKEEEDWQGVNVWYDTLDGSTNCVECQGALSGMLSSCKHCEAVKRYVLQFKKQILDIKKN